ncbi:MAG: LTA synthase family protein [Bacillota bacterium]|nr:LTA synthase family protein [Bacillota bacterium]
MNKESLVYTKPLNYIDENFYDQKKKSTLTAIILFIFFNTVKIVIFDRIILSPMSFGILMYKLVFTLVFDAAIFLFILKFKSRSLFIIFYVVQAIYLFANMAYYIYYYNYLHLLLSPVLLSESVDAVSHFSIPADPRLLTILIDLPVFIYLCITYKRTEPVKRVLKLTRKISFGCCLAILVIAEIVGGITKDFTPKLIDTYAKGGETEVVRRYGTIGNNIADILVNIISKSKADRLEYSNEAITASAKINNPNIVVIQVESMDSSVINQKYKNNYIAPFLHSLSEKYIYYPYTVSYHRAGGTSDCEFSIINSVEPLDDFPAMKIKDYDFPNSMVNKLKEGSYNTIAFHGNVGSFFNRDKAFPVMGFNDYLDLDKMKLKDNGWGASDGSLLDYVQNYMKTEKTPFFNYIITLTMHRPFSEADNYYHNKNYDDIDNNESKGYFNSVSYTDQTLSRFVNYVKENYRNTYIFIWGDHTPKITTDYYKQSSFVTSGKYFEFVPLIIITPDNKIYKEDKFVASFLDLGPTILDISGVPFNIRSDGEDLMKGLDSHKTIPFKGTEYDRAYLFEKIKNENESK